MSGFGFEVTGRDGAARRGRLRTGHGDVDTPVFMPVGTQATVKSLTAAQVAATGAGLILGNTYHLYLRPGADVVREMGGLHRFAAWPGAMLTDSGGFQVFSLSGLTRVDTDGVDFRSHLDGSRHRFTPESAMAIQADLGADIVMAFDHCPALPATRGEVAAAVDRTVDWARRCASWFGPRRRDPHPHEQVLFGIVQGGLEEDLRRECAEALVALDLPGYAIGGLSVGEAKEDMHRLAGFTAACLPEPKPRYVMGVGFPEDILAAVAGGVDMFDCVLPTRMARNGTLLTRAGRLALKNARFARDPRPVEEDCDCLGCREHTRAYLRHLIIAGETLGLTLCTLHNLRFYQRLMAGIRDAIASGRYAAHRAEFLAAYTASGGHVP